MVGLGSKLSLVSWTLELARGWGSTRAVWFLAQPLDRRVCSVKLVDCPDDPAGDISRVRSEARLPYMGRSLGPRREVDLTQRSGQQAVHMRGEDRR